MNVTKVILFWSQACLGQGTLHQKMRTLSEGLFCLHRQHILHKRHKVEGSDEALYVPYHMSYNKSNNESNVIIQELYFSRTHSYYFLRVLSHTEHVD